MQARDVMTGDPAVCTTGNSVVDAARLMRDRDIGDVLVTDDGNLYGIVTDRDIVVRALAEHPDPSAVTLRQVCSGDVKTVSADAEVADIVALMEKNALRRVPVVDGDRPIGIVSIGDLAVERDPDSALGQISAAPPSR